MTELRRPVVFISDIPPSLNFSGGIFTSQVMQAIGSALERAFVIQNRHIEPELDPAVISDGFRLKTVVKPIEQYYSEDNEEDRYAAEQSILSGEIPYIVADILEFVSDLADPILWIVLEGQTLIRVAYELAQETDLPMIAQVMDPPEWWLRAHNVDPASQSEVLSKYRAVLRRADALAAASWAMAEDYGARFGSPTIPVVPSLPAAIRPPRRGRRRQTGDFTIGFAGQLYASDEWHCLMGALDDLGWQIAGRDIAIRAHVAETSLGTIGCDRPITLGPWLSQPELVRELSECDLLYCAYWFDPKFEAEARLCFPSKLTTYLATGRPVLFHGPAYASPARFLMDRGAGFLCDSLEFGVIQRTIADAVTNKKRYREVAMAGASAFEQHLTAERLRTSVLSMLENLPARHAT